MSGAFSSVVREREDIRVNASARYFTLFRHIDFTLLFLVITLTLAGIATLKGAVLGIAALEPVVTKQIAFFWIALAVLAFTFLLDYRWLNRTAILVYTLNIGALIFVIVKGSSVNGARSWIDFGPVNWQPSETMKIATALVGAQWMALHPEGARDWRGIIIPGIICGVPALLVLMQPDLGTASLFFVLCLAMMLIGGVPRRRIAIIVLAAIMGLASAYPFLKPYQKNRLIVFVNPEADPAGAGYNVIQSKIAVGSGGLFGQGWGGGTQSTHRFLPEHHTDFIFASFIEQFGFVGGVAILAAYLLLVWRMMRAIETARDRFGAIVVAGLAAVFVGHVVENVGMTMGVFPVTGIPLPFLSYGGSFLITTFVLFGIVMNVASRRYTLAGP
ncbi:MAG TPA: rod shape-determining protein RodA [Candidatus Sumerlaeota bacterium]|nr:rod shape-determining protein RodA [Candidatus Sumerlaeota bacterium]